MLSYNHYYRILLICFLALHSLEHLCVLSFQPLINYSHNAKSVSPHVGMTQIAKNLRQKYSMQYNGEMFELTMQRDRNGEEKETVVGFLIPVDADVIPSKFGSKSPVSNPSILDAVNQVCRKVKWFSDDTVSTVVINTASYNIDDLKDVDTLIALGLTSDSDLSLLQQLLDARNNHDSSEKKAGQCHFALECKNIGSSMNRVSLYRPNEPSFSSQYFPWTQDASAKRMENEMMGLFQRWTSDDFVVAILLFLNQFSGQEIDWVKHSIDATWEKGPVQNAREFYKMMDSCGDCIIKAVQDENTKKCIDTLQTVNTRDQVASYRTIVSFESEQLKDFSYCILQKNNIFDCDAKIPTMPYVKPISSWKGEELTTEAAQQILIAHLDDTDAPPEGSKSPVSWTVAAGANVAYDQFPSQNQIFYKNVGGKGMWYDPVFRVETIDGRSVWCKRHYKVRSGEIPGTFHLSVLDNGVTSSEFWTIAGVADDLSWIVFHYAGAAKAVGMRYLGGLLCTADGSLPPESENEHIWKALKSAGIEPWELFVVDNRKDTPSYLEAGQPPLDYYLKSVMEKKLKKQQSESVSNSIV